MSADNLMEQRLRRLLKKEGLLLRKSRVRNRQAVSYGGYMIINLNNVIEAGENYSFTLDRVESWLK